MSNNQPLNSSRVRGPATSGRSNLSARGSMTMDSPKYHSSNNNDDDISLAASVKERLNNPLMVFRPFTPEGRVMDCYKKRPPILPKSIETTYPDEPERVRQYRGRDKLTCPEEFRLKLQAPNFFETADFKTLLDDSQKERFCRSFIERNRNRLWKFDLKYIGMTPRSVCDDIVENHEFIGIMRSYHIKEQSLNLGASEKVSNCLKDNQFNSLGEIRNDLTLTSLTTSREQREDKLRKLLAPALQQHGSKHFRGFNHASEYGNFSKFSGFLQSNQGSMLQR